MGDSMLKVLGAALAAMVFAAPAGAAVITVNSVIHNPHTAKLAHGQFSLLVDNFKPVTLNAGDTFNYSAFLDRSLSVQKQGGFSTLTAEIGFEPEPSCTWECNFTQKIINTVYKLPREQNLSYYGAITPDYEILILLYLYQSTDNSIEGLSASIDFIGPPGSTATVSTFSMLAIAAPEPSSWALMLSGAAAIFAAAWKQRKRLSLMRA